MRFNSINKPVIREQKVDVKISRVQVPIGNGPSAALRYLQAWRLPLPVYYSTNMSHLQDPRFEDTATYDRDQVVSIVSEFYKFLARMLIVEPEDVLFPPPGCWPNINKERFAALAKSGKVVALLANLPYNNMSSLEYPVAPFTYSLGYWGERFQESFERGGRSENKRLAYSFIPGTFAIGGGRVDDRNSSWGLFDAENFER